MSYEDKSLAEKPPEPEVKPWDSGETVSPDPSLPVESQLTWLRIASHVLLLNVSERVRRAAAAEADRELARVMSGPRPGPAAPVTRHADREAVYRDSPGADIDIREL